MAANQGKRIYRILFHSQGKIYELYARDVHQSAILGFIEIEDMIFGERSAVVVDPSEERLKAEFAGVKRTSIPMHAVIRIDEVDKEGINKIIDGVEGANITPFPVPVYPPRGDSR